MSENLALDYLKEIYRNGAISSDAYDITVEEDGDYLSNLSGDKGSIKKQVLNLLNDVGSISSDAYDMEMSEI